MSGIAGFCCFTNNLREEAGRWYPVLGAMSKAQTNTEEEHGHYLLSSHAGLSCTCAVKRDSKDDLPLRRQLGSQIATIVFHGEIYNQPELIRYLREEHVSCDTWSPDEIMLMGYLGSGIDFVKKVNGVFSFCIFDETRNRLYLVRDRLGVKPLYYTLRDNTLIFSTHPDSLFCHPGIDPVLDQEGLCEIFGVGPAKTPTKGVFRDIRQLLPGTALSFEKNCCNEEVYWQLSSHPHEDKPEQTVEKTRALIIDSVHLQMEPSEKVCTLLSGGIDSSLVTSICNTGFREREMCLSSYSFDFVQNDKHFQANDFQPSLDRPFVDQMVSYVQTDHHYLECDCSSLYTYLFKAVDARGLPCMADVESSLLYFCQEVAKEKEIALTGECADEIFGGYPWFHKESMIKADTFPWSMDSAPRTMLLKDELTEFLPLEAYARQAYEDTISSTPVWEEDTPAEKRRRELMYLTIRWFMQTLLDRMDCVANYTGLIARVPFADYRLVAYLWNVPTDIKNHSGEVKGLLRQASRGLLPDEILHRRKSPYPKTYDPKYEELLKNKLLEVLTDTASPLRNLVELQKVLSYFEKPSNLTKPFYGQLMAGPQLIAYMLQINYWLEHNHIKISL